MADFLVVVAALAEAEPPANGKSLSFYGIHHWNKLGGGAYIIALPVVISLFQAVSGNTVLAISAVL